MSTFHALNDLHRELSRVFDDRPLFRYESVDNNSSNWRPQVDIRENEDGFTVYADVPGIDPGDVDITLHNGVLTIKGERSTASDQDYRRRERVRGSFLRQFSLPESVDENGVTATANNGVLEISIPRSAQAKPLSITVEGE